MKGVVQSLLRIGAMLGRPKATRAYPEEQPDLPPRSRARLVLTSDPDGEERCVACGLCAAVCPVDCIAMAKAERADGRWFAETFRVNHARCIFCGLCEEACPTAAIQLTPDYHLATTERPALVLEKADLLVSHQGKAPGYRYWEVAGKGRPPDPGMDPWSLMP
jgi:NADH-quinone oxidoreductase subunit I